MVYRAFKITAKIAIDMNLRYRCVPACGLLRDLPSYLCRLTKNRKKVGCIDKNTKNNKMKFKWFGNKSCLNIKRKKKGNTVNEVKISASASVFAQKNHPLSLGEPMCRQGLERKKANPATPLSCFHVNACKHLTALSCNVLQEKRNEDDLQTYYQAYQCENVVMMQENWL